MCLVVIILLKTRTVDEDGEEDARESQLEAL